MASAKASNMRFQKLAIYTKPDGQADGEPTHVVKQLSSSRWTSKMGSLEDIEHELNALRGFYYGAVAQILKRPVSLSRR
jgi:hypothetical protein